MVGNEVVDGTRGGPLLMSHLPVPRNKKHQLMARIEFCFGGALTYHASRRPSTPPQNGGDEERASDVARDIERDTRRGGYFVATSSAQACCHRASAA